jgi:hypothetical protein
VCRVARLYCESRQPSLFDMCSLIPRREILGSSPTMPAPDQNLPTIEDRIPEVVADSPKNTLPIQLIQLKTAPVDHPRD